MNSFKLFVSNIKHFFAANFWVALGISISTAVLTGGLIVGDSVKYSLGQAAELRLGNITHALTTGERFVTTDLAHSLNESGIACSQALKLRGNATANGGQLKLNNVAIWGIDDGFWKVAAGRNDSAVFLAGDESRAYISENTAKRLNLSPGDEILLRIEKASLIPANAPFVSDEGQIVSKRIKIEKILTIEELGGLNLRTSQTAPFNIFLPIDELNRWMELGEKANVLLISSEKTVAEIENYISINFSLADAALNIAGANLTNEWELTSGRVFIDDATSKNIENSGLETSPLFTYFVNSFSSGNRETPYSFISTLPNDRLSENDIVVNEWLADDLMLKAGDSLLLKYYTIGPLRELTEDSVTFTVKEVVPIEGYFADQGLMPHIPGLSDAENCRDWQTGVPVNLGAIRDKDEDYWYKYRGLPKAFVAYDVAQKLWKNRYGSVTAFRFDRNQISKPELERAILEQINPFELDMQLEAVKEQGLQAARNGTDFSQLFLGLSFFILVSGVLLTALLFGYNLERRSSEIGTLSSLGFSKRGILKLFLSEGLFFAVLGALLGSFLAIGYNRLVFWGLNHVWNDIVRTQVLIPKIEVQTLVIGFFVSIAVAILTIYLSLSRSLKKQTASIQRKTANALGKRAKTVLNIFAWFFLTAAFVMSLLELMKSKGNLNSGLFFMAGGMLLLSIMLFILLAISRNPRQRLSPLSKTTLAIRNLKQSRIRSMTVIALLAIGTFLVVSTGLNRKDFFSKENDPKSGTGGFLFWAETSVPLLHNLNNSAYRQEQGFMQNFTAVQMRVNDGDDASCLNLNKISNPRVLGVDPAQLKGRFSLQTKTKHVNQDDFWQTLDSENDHVIPAFADQTVIQWGLMKKVGDTLTYKNEFGEDIYLVLAGGLSASVFQGNVIISEKAFLHHFPTSNGSRVFLIDGPEESREAIFDELTLAFRDLGIQISPTAERLAEFKTIENTYLTIFLVLGALGLLIGTVGLAIVLQRSLLERKAEFALLASVGFSKRMLLQLIRGEYILLLFTGIVSGLITAFISVFPAIRGTVENLSPGFVVLLIALILLNGIIWVFVLSWLQLKQPVLVEALRND
ncbi:MAG: FtsX-like permease family protein [Prolixibacteraceae bacterium]|nr:FtsX-like permease family protein [Prolixibacteraceae bacterium]